MKGDTMRPLIEILEDERTLLQKLESVCRYMLKTDDTDALDILMGQKKRIERELAKIHKELRRYLNEISSGVDEEL